MRIPTPLHTAFLAATLALLSGCSDKEAAAATPTQASPPAVIELHPLVQVERALAATTTTQAEFWRLGVDILGWDLAGTANPTEISLEELRAWTEEDLRLSSVGDWPYEFRRPLVRGTMVATQHDS